MKDNKQFGELAEQMFALEVMKRGGVPCKPIGDCQPYDWVVLAKKQFHRVQVKSCWNSIITGNRKRSLNRCSVTISHGKTRKIYYNKNKIDFFAIWVDPFNSWIIKSVEKAVNKKTLKVGRVDCESPSWSLLGL